MGRWRRLLGAAAVLGCLVAATVGSSASSAPSQPTTLCAVFASFPDYLDPQLSYTAEGWTAMRDVYVPLLTFRHAEGKEGTEVVPGLARDLPRITNGGRTYTLFLRPGLRYSDGTPVRASDFEYAVERMIKLFGGGSPFYSEAIVGAERFEATGRGGISGIVSDNRSGKIVIHLVEPSSSFTSLLALPFAALVPRGTPMHDLSLDPPPATGPYAIVSSEPGVGWAYARNPAWSSDNGPAMPDYPSGSVERIEVSVVRSGDAEVRRVIDGKADWMQNPPPAYLVPDLRESFEGSQLRFDRIPSTYYFWMNMRRPPFSDLRVRRAANYAVNPAALRRIYGGQLDPAHQILPPDFPGFERFNLYPYDLRKARRLIAAAKPRDRRITVWTDTESPNNEAGRYFAGQLRKIGFRVRLKVVNADNYFTVIGSRRTRNLDAGWSDWFMDYPHPDDFFRPLLFGGSILRFYNGNFAKVAVPRLDAKIRSLGRRPLGPATERAYAELDRSYMELAPWVPYGTRVLSTFVSRAVDFDRVVFNPVFGAELTSFQFKNG